MSTRETVIEVLAWELGFREEDVKTTDGLVVDLGCDDLDFINIAMAIEEQYGLKYDITDEDIGTVFEKPGATVQDVIDLVERKLAAVK